MRLRKVVCVLAAVALAAACSDDADGGADDPGGEPAPSGVDTVRYVLPPGNFGGLPPSENSTDQLPLYDGLTPLRDDITDADITEHYLPADFEPIEPVTVEETGRPGLELVYDAYGIPHITGETRADVAFGAGWITARDRDLLLRLARGPARVAVADVPGIDAFGLVTSGQEFVPSAEAEALIDDQWALMLEELGEEGEEILADAEAGAEGANAYYESIGNPIEPPINANDVLAVTAFIGSIFGAGGGGEVRNAELLAAAQAAMGDEQGRAAWEDAMLSVDPEAPTSIDETFDYGPLTGGDVVGSVVIDPGSVRPLDPREPASVAEVFPGADSGAPLGEEDDEAAVGSVDATDVPPGREASNFLLVSPERSGSGQTLGVMGPQLGYYYPEIVQQVHLRGPGFEAQGVAVPGLTMYMLIGRTADYAWSLTSAGHDIRDVYVEELCDPAGGEPSLGSGHYVFDGECTPMELFDAGTLGGEPIVFPTTVHGPVIGSATVDGEPVVLSRRRSTFGRDGLNLAALKAMTEGEAETPEDFFEIANRFEFTFNWAYASREATAFFSSGRMPVRPEGLDRRLPTLGTGEYEWEGFLALDEHPHDVEGPEGLILNWNNQSAPGFMHGDSDGFGPMHRVLLFDQWPDDPQLADVVGIMNRAATTDTRSPVWPTVSEVLAAGEAPSELAADVVALLDEWVAEGAPRLDADDDGAYDSPGPAAFDAVMTPVVEALLEPVWGDQLEALGEVRSIGGDDGTSFVSKDLRSLLGQDVVGPFQLAYCGAGELDACAASLWAAVDASVAAAAAELGPDPATWLVEADRTGFIPGLLPDTMRTTNRPTYQQVVEWAGSRPS